MQSSSKAFGNAFEKEGAWKGEDFENNSFYSTTFAIFSLSERKGAGNNLGLSGLSFHRCSIIKSFVDGREQTASIRTYEDMQKSLRGA